VAQRRRRFRLSGRDRYHGVSDVLSALLLVAITIILVVAVYLIRFPLGSTPPTVLYQAVTDATKPVWGDPTDCYPVLPHNPNYYLGNGTHNQTDINRYNAYMNAWWSDCEYGDNGTYRNMNVTLIEISRVSAPIPLSDVEFEFICTNSTPTYLQTTLVSGPLSAMEWEPGFNQTIPSNAPVIGKCATFDANGAGGGANSVYYNRLGYFDPVNFNEVDLSPGQTVVVYVHTPNSVLEAPNPIEPVSTWNISDGDDYHGAPPWCFTVPNACTIELLDTVWSPAVVLATIPLYLL